MSPETLLNIARGFLALALGAVIGAFVIGPIVRITVEWIREVADRPHVIHKRRSKGETYE